MIIDLYKDKEDIITEFKILFPDVGYKMYNHIDGVYIFLVFSNDMKIINKVNAEMFHFKGLIHDMTINPIQFRFRRETLTSNYIISYKTNIKINKDIKWGYYFIPETLDIYPYTEY
jgi:hypothetical protein